MCGRLLVVVAVLLLPGVAAAQEGKVTLISRVPFARVAEQLEKAIEAQKMALVCHANAQRGAAARGVKIAGNQVFMVFRNDFAVRILKVAPEAGIEAPIRIYLYENQDGTATLTYMKPSAAFRPYPHPEVANVAAELDPVVDAIAVRAIAVK